MNAKQELIAKLDGKLERIICATISNYVWGWGEEEKTNIDLLLGYTPEDLDLFLKSLDFEYDNGFGLQEVDGTIWLSDGTWMRRWEYDGSEGWERMMCPNVPEKLYPIGLNDSNGNGNVK